MTYEELRQVAKRHGLVQWSRSGRIEQLFIKYGDVIARHTVTLRKHIIWPRNKDYYCREVPLEENVRFGDLLK